MHTIAAEWRIRAAFSVGRKTRTLPSLCLYALSYRYDGMSLLPWRKMLPDVLLRRPGYHTVSLNAPRQRRGRTHRLTVVESTACYMDTEHGILDKLALAPATILLHKSRGRFRKLSGEAAAPPAKPRRTQTNLANPLVGARSNLRFFQSTLSLGWTTCPDVPFL